MRGHEVEREAIVECQKGANRQVGTPSLRPSAYGPPHVPKMTASCKLTVESDCPESSRDERAYIDVLFSSDRKGARNSEIISTTLVESFCLSCLKRLCFSASCCSRLG